MGRFLSSKVSELNNNNFDNFMADKPNIPKCILFTNKAGNPLIFRALSLTFDKRIDFGLVRSTDTGITAKYRVNSYPKIMVIGVGDKKVPQFYEGENTYNKIFLFINPFAETFFRVGEDKTRPNETTKADKPWLSEVSIVIFIMLFCVVCYVFIVVFNLCYNVFILIETT